MLNRRLDALRDAELAADLVEVVHFSSCPACFADVWNANLTEHACHLCKTPLGTERAKERVVDLINEVSIQLKQSSKLQEVRRQCLLDAKAKFASTQDEWKAKARELSALSVRPTF